MDILKKKRYNMLDDKPIWAHLLEGGERREHKITPLDRGFFAEKLGCHYLGSIETEFFDEVFPDIEIINVSRLKGTRYSVLLRGDRRYRVDYKKNDVYGKKLVVFEIKYGKVSIPQGQLRHLCKVIINPGCFVKKADEAKVFFLIYDKITDIHGSCIFHLCELTKELAERVLESYNED